MTTTRTLVADTRSTFGWAFVVLGALAGVALLHRETFASMVEIWIRSETFAHCFLIVPVSAYLVWQRRHDLMSAPKSVSTLGLVVMAALTVAWLVAHAVRVQFGEQLAVTLLIPATVWALLGAEVTKRLTLPLGYLLFMVPFGEFLIPTLMELTASFTVRVLQLTGIPVLREGLFFSIPSGDFEVAKACSGIRYLIACLALGVLFANITYRSWRKRLLFIAASIVTPLLGNCIRAYLIVMIAHWSDMKLAVGVDHLIYGWLFFGLLIFVMFWIGSCFEDKAPVAAAVPPAENAPGATSPMAARLVAAVAGLALVAIGPVTAARNDDVAAPGAAAQFAWPSAAGAWRGPAIPGEAWVLPEFNRRAAGVYFAGASTSVEIEALTCCSPGSERELVGGFAALVDPAEWQTLQTRRIAVAAGGQSLGVVETVLRSRAEERVVWYSYVVDGKVIASDWRAKLAEGWLALRGRQPDSTLVLLSSAAPEAANAREALGDFMRDNGERIVGCVATANCPAAR